jgi:hypothetical protein
MAETTASTNTMVNRPGSLTPVSFISGSCQVSLRADPKAKDATVISVGASTYGACKTPSTKSELTKKNDHAMPAPDHHGEISPLSKRCSATWAPDTMRAAQRVLTP